MAKSNMRFAALLLMAQLTSFTLAQKGTYAPTVTTASPTVTTASPTITTIAPSLSPSITTLTPSVSPTIAPSTQAPSTSPTTAAPTESPTVPPTMPALTDAQAVASIAAARARVAYRNNAVAPGSIDPVDDVELGGKKCPADYHLMGGDDHSIVSGGTAYAPSGPHLIPPRTISCLVCPRVVRSALTIRNVDASHPRAHAPHTKR